MALDFPNNPAKGQQFAGANGVVYSFDGVAWRALGQAGGSIDWANITGKPDAFPPQSHAHEQGEVVGLPEALAGKAPTVHTHMVSDLRLPAGTTPDQRLVSKADGSIGLVPPAAADSPVHFGTAPPDDPAAKPLWFDTNAGALMVHYDDGNSAQWVPSIPGAGGGSPPPDPGGPTSQIFTREGPALTGRDGSSIEAR